MKSEYEVILSLKLLGSTNQRNKKHEIWNKFGSLNINSPCLAFH